MNGTVNKVILVGHLGDNVKMHYFDGGNCVGRFQLATNEVFISKTTNQKTVTTDWHSIVVKNKMAETFEKYLSKGDKVYVEGKMRSRQWIAEDGSTKYSSEIQVSDFTFLSTKRDLENKKKNDVAESVKNSNFDASNNGLPINDLPF